MVEQTGIRGDLQRGGGILCVRHMEVRYLWVQEVVGKGRVIIKKVSGKINPADVLTKPLSFRLAQDLLAPIGVLFGESLSSIGSGRGGGVGDGTP